jgi:putative two-component system response regulator
MESFREKIVLVDDNMTNLTIGKDLLKASYEVFLAPSAAKLFLILEKIIPSLILLDISMPEMNGYEAIKKLKADARYAHIPVIFLTAKDDERSELEGFELGAADYVTKPFSGPILLKRIASQLLIVRQKAALKDYTDNLEKKVEDKTREVLSLQNTVLTTVADMIEFRDHLTGGHTNRTRLYLQVLAGGLVREGLYADVIAQWDLDSFLRSSQLHDVGKIGISDLLLNKPGKLTPEEYEMIKMHVPVGKHIIEKIMRGIEEDAFLHYALLITEYHHEKWDGSGYPKGLEGGDIPLEGRLMALADVYDALISVRPYKKALPHEVAYNLIMNGAGSHFDPVLTDVFQKVAGEFARVAWENRD